jgi:hypothetical protein
MLGQDRQWLWSLGGIDLHAENDDAFRRACQFGHLETAQWLWSLGGIDMHAENDGAFRWACQFGQLQTAQWLWSMRGVDVHALADFAFQKACELFQLETAKWLFSLDPEWRGWGEWLLVLKTWSKPRNCWILACLFVKTSQ